MCFPKSGSVQVIPQHDATREGKVENREAENLMTSALLFLSSLPALLCDSGTFRWGEGLCTCGTALFTSTGSQDDSSLVDFSTGRLFRHSTPPMWEVYTTIVERSSRRFV